MEKELLRRYVAIKPKSYEHYIWFFTENVDGGLGILWGRGGWGKDGTFTNIKIKSSEIEAFIYSDELKF